MPVVKFLCAIVGVVFLLALLVQPACACSNLTSVRYAAMRGDLRNLYYVQELFYEDHARYARSMDELIARQFQPTTYVSLTLTSVSDSVWKATATHSMLIPEIRCEIANADNASSIAKLNGEPACDPPYKKRRWRLRTVW
jgi:hypothetical protein